MKDFNSRKENLDLRKGMLNQLSKRASTKKNNSQFQEKWLIEIEEKVSDISDRITSKEKRITECIGNSDYEKCDCLRNDIMALKQDRRELLAEKDRLIASNCKDASSDTPTTENDPFSPIALDSDFGPFTPQDNSNPSSLGTNNLLLPLPSH